MGDNNLGGTITSDVGVFVKLKKLILYGMGLDGKICMSQQTCIVCLLTFTCVLQESCPRSSATSSI